MKTSKLFKRLVVEATGLLAKSVYGVNCAVFLYYVEKDLKAETAWSCAVVSESGMCTISSFCYD